MFLALDTETGGIGPDKSLLTLYAVALDDNLNPVAFSGDDFKVAGGILELDLKLKPDDGIYRVTGEALGINGINLSEHDKEAIPCKKAGTLLYEFLERCYRINIALRDLRRDLQRASPSTGPAFTGPASPGGLEPGTKPDPDDLRLVPVGHNVAFDCRVLTNCLVSPGSWSKFVSYRVLDTCSIARFMTLVGLIPKGTSCGMEGLAEYFGVKAEGELHEAKYDTMLCAGVLRKMIRLARGPLA